MATRRLVLLEDDIDGSAADETVAFALDGNFYDIDLTGVHAEELCAALRPYIAAARTVPPKAGPGQHRQLRRYRKFGRGPGQRA